MAAENRPQIYLKTPLRFASETFQMTLESVLAAAEIACIRLTTSASTPDEIQRQADLVREIAHARDISLVIDTHFRMVQPLGLDGVHLLDGTKNLREARKLLGPDGIVGVSCGSSRHMGMSAAEMTADYVTFGPLLADPLIGDGSVADVELFAWWSEMIEVPVVAEGNVTLEMAKSLAKSTDFVGLGDEVWLHPNGPVAAIKAFAEALK